MDDLISRAEAIKSLNGEVAVTGKANKDEVVSYIKTIMMRIKDLPSADRPKGEWIPCSDRLPSEKKAVLICDSGGNRFAGELVLTDYGYKWKIQFFKVWMDIEDGDAWMPLPEPYKESDTE